METLLSGGEGYVLLRELEENTPENRHLETWRRQSFFEVVKRQKDAHFLAYFWKYSKTHRYKTLSILIKIQVKLRCIMRFLQHPNALASKFRASENMEKHGTYVKCIF